jgi:hypothetical protein
MDDTLGRHSAGCRNHCVSGRQSLGKFLRPDFFALLQYFRATCTMNRAIDAATAHQSAVGGIDDGIDLFFSDVADFNRNSTVKKSF